MKVSLYIRERSTRKQHKHNPRKTYPLDGSIIWMLRYGKTWETLDVKSLGEATTLRLRRSIELDGGWRPLRKERQEQESDQLTLYAAIDKYFTDLESRGVDAKSILTYRYAISQFAKSCKKQYVKDVTKQDMIDYMGYLRKQPQPMRKHSNPERTYNNKCSHVVIFLKTFGHTGLLKKSEYPAYEEKTVTAHTGEELETIYAGCTTDDQRFFLDFSLNTGLRKGELMHVEYSDLKGSILEIKRKPHFNWHPKKQHCRKITVPAFIADQMRERAKSHSCGLLFPSIEKCEPDGHIDRVLEIIAANVGAKFHVELHKLRKTAATRWAEAGIPVHVIQKMLGHKNLATTQRYLADVDMASERMSKAVESAAFVPSKAKLEIVRTGTGGD